MRPTSSRSGKNTSKELIWLCGVEDEGDDPRGEGVVALEHHFAGLGVDDVGEGEGTLEIGLGDLDFRDLELLQLVEDGGRDLLARVEQLLALARGVLGPVDGLAELQAEEVIGDRPVELPFADLDAVALVEGPEDLAVALQAHGAQEDGGQELALAVDAHVEQVLGVVLELHPAAAVGDDLGREEALLGLGEEDAGRPVELAHDDPLRPVDDEGAVLRHQGDVAVVDLLLLDVADGLGPRLRVLVPHHEADRDLQGHREGHAPLLALVDVVLELQAHGLVAGLAGDGLVLVQAAAARAVDLAVPARIGDEGGGAEGAGPPQLVETDEPAALAFPVADRVVDELERAVLAQVADRKDALEHGLEARVFPVARQHAHLQEALVRVLLDLDEVGDGDRGLDLGEVDPFPVNVLGSRVHFGQNPSVKSTEPWSLPEYEGPKTARPGGHTSPRECRYGS